MFQYFKGYTIGICVIAVALPVVTSTIWPFVTGEMMASSFMGMVMMFVLFAIGLFLGYFIFSKLADSRVQVMLDEYNNNCDPSLLIHKGAQIATQIAYPCNQAASWFMGYYGQALLDAGNVQMAKNILGGLRLSIDAAKGPEEKAGILVNYLQLDEKIDGMKQALDVVNEGIGYCKQAKGSHAASYLDFLDSQKTILEDLLSPDKSKAIAVCEKVRADAAYPARLRVEYAWIEASKLYGSGDDSKEASCLQFIIRKGNKLALVDKARARLKDL